MLKFLRKYNKIILAIGGSLLLVAFIAPQAIQQLGRGLTDVKVATINGETVRQSDRAAANSELSIIAGVVSGNANPELVIASLTGGAVALDSERTEDHWLMLTTEAEEAGLVGGAADGAGFIDRVAFRFVPELAQQQAQILSAQARQTQDFVLSQQSQLLQATARGEPGTESIAAQIAGQFAESMELRRTELINRFNLSPEGVDLALAKAVGVERLIGNAFMPIRATPAETANIAKQQLDSALVEIINIPASAVVDPTETPTAEQRLAHFEQFSDREPGSGELGFGYRLPNRVKLAWITIDPSVISDAITIPLADIAREKLDKPDLYPGELNDERARIEAALRNERTQEVVETAESTIRAEVNRSLRQLSFSGDYRVLPPDWSPPNWRDVADAVSAAVRAQHGVEIPPPSVDATVRWLGAQQVQELLPGETIRVAGGNFPAAAVIFSASREFTTQRVDIALQARVPFTTAPIVAPGGSRRFFTITDVATPAVPATPDDLLDPDQLDNDWRELQAYNRLAARIDELRALAATEGLEAVTETLGVDDIEPRRQPLPLGQVPEQLEPLRLAAVDITASLDPLQPAYESDADARTAAVALPQANRAIAVFQVLHLQPLTTQQLRLAGDQVAARVVQQSVLEETERLSPFTFDALAARQNYVLLEASDEAAATSNGSDDNAGEAEG
ncbi:MAG: hypothetical protein AAF747_06385 [Planctomycetota bacterium]